MSRTARQRFDAIRPSIIIRDEFHARAIAAAGDVPRSADLMAEAIGMLIDADGLENVGSDGKVVASIENLTAVHCLIAAREVYLRAKRSNESSAPQPATLPE